VGTAGQRFSRETPIKGLVPPWQGDKPRNRGSGPPRTPGAGY
jgi:hypothetical protein